MTEYYIGQIFTDIYPADAADWCNNNNAYIDEIEPENNIRRFEIKEQPQETSTERKARFLRDFFKVSLGDLGVGYYRKKPKGYQSAVESINTAQIMCSKMNGLPEGILIFYQQPNFNKPEECTEEWLEQHQTVLPAMTVEQFDTLYVSFITAWNTQEHN